MAGIFDIETRVKEMESGVHNEEETSDDGATIDVEAYDDGQGVDTDTIPDELTTDEWTAETVRLLEQVKTQIAERFARMEKRNDEQHQISEEDHATAEKAISSLMQAEAKFYSHINIELPGIIKKNIEAASQGILDAQLEIIAGDIKGIIHQHITAELSPQLSAIKDLTIDLRLAANEVESKAGGWKQFIKTACVASAIGTVIFFGLKAQFGLGIDAEYGRKARVAIQKLDAGSRATMEQLIGSK